ncbi:MAG: LytTR family DNA-binding domain-containing protein [Defluviitaleaceae bacterium]|nr:LytTR family DNA-binding domain-containing protein [Defluviitaleaceae bacterium]
MLHILICEDDIRQRIYMESVVKEHITTKDDEMKLALSSSSPAQILAYTKAHPDKGGLYFLDIDLQHDEMNGIELGAEIRGIDPLAKIVFVTTHSELAHLTFKHKISALDYIVKDRPEEIEMRIHECIKEAHRRYLQEKHEQMKYFKVDANGEVWSIPYDDILFFETHVNIRHRVIIHTENGKIDFRGFLGEIEKLVPEFFRSHKSYLLNIDKISYIDKLTKEAVMPNGKRALVAQKKIAGLVEIIGKR